MKCIDESLLKEITRRVAETVHPEKIILFGSYAWGQPTEDSDVDLFVVVAPSNQPTYRRVRAAYKALRGLKVPVDIVMQTQSEVERSSMVATSLVKKVFEEGRVYMTDPRIHETIQWLLKANNDLLSAERLFNGAPPLLDTAAYHCQQTMEKGLKAYLTYHETPFQKIHHLSVLVSQCLDMDPSFDQLFDIADMLTPYAVIFRYPGDVFEPDSDDVKEALDAAKQVWRFILDKIPEAVEITKELIDE